MRSRARGPRARCVGPLSACIASASLGSSSFVGETCAYRARARSRQKAPNMVPHGERAFAPSCARAPRACGARGRKALSTLGETEVTNAMCWPPGLALTVRASTSFLPRLKPSRVGRRRVASRDLHQTVDLFRHACRRRRDSLALHRAEKRRFEQPLVRSSLMTIAPRERAA